jgi:integrase
MFDLCKFVLLKNKPMNVVEACTKSDIEMVHNLLKRKYPPIYADVWKVGVNMSLRISDLLAIKNKDLNIAKRSLKLIDQKTQKPNEVRLNAPTLEIVHKRWLDNPDDIWLFQSHSRRSNDKPITRGSVAAVFKEAGEQLGLTINTHSMRKSRGKAMYDAGIPVQTISKVLNHSNPVHTMVYLGINREAVLKTYDDFEL